MGQGKVFTLNTQIIFKLIIRQGPSPGEEFELNPDQVIIGRESGVGFLIAAPGVSRNHARLLKRSEGYWIEDLGSSNGTFVNGIRLQDRIQLNHGDQISLGQTILLQYEVHAPVSTQAPDKIEDPYKTRNVASIDEPIDTPSEVPVVVEKSPENAAVAQTLMVQDLDIERQSTPPRLVVTVAGEETLSYNLSKPQISLGRSNNNDIVVNARLVSRSHAHLVRVGQGYQISVSPEASNPIYYQGRVLNGIHQLNHGDTLRIGGFDPGLMVTIQYDSPSEMVDAGAQAIVFGEKSIIQLGRDPGNDVLLSAPMISRFHAQIEKIGQRYRIRDLRSSNGTFVNDQLIEGEVWLKPEDNIRIGPYRFVMGQDEMSQIDETSGLKVDSINLNKWVRKDLNILQNISLTFNPREFIVVVGQSGGGKSTLVDSIAGYRPATHGQVFVNNIDIYRNFDAIRNDIGFVPQKDITCLGIQL